MNAFVRFRDHRDRRRWGEWHILNGSLTLCEQLAAWHDGKQEGDVPPTCGLCRQCEVAALRIVGIVERMEAQ